MQERLSDLIELSGIPPSGLPFSACVSSDYLYVSRRALPVDQCRNYYSCGARYGELLDRLVSDISAELGLGSMAYCESADYSPVGHLHSDYNKVSVSAVYGGISDIPIATVTVDGESTVIREPAAVIRRLPPPVIGQIRFSALPAGAQPGDGWVIPDGTRYPLSEYDGECARVFDHDGVWFTVPALSDFFRVPTELDGMRSSAAVPANEPVPSHIHLARIQLEGECDGTFNYWCTGNWNPGNGSHGSVGKSGEFDIELKLTCNSLKIQSGSHFKPAGGQGGSYPSHMVVPALIYIGQKRS